MSDVKLSDGMGDVPVATGDTMNRFPFGEVPAFLDVMPESNREVLVLGDVIRCRELNHRQGENPYGFQGTCGLVSCEDVLRQFGVDVNEAEVVRHAVSRGLCAVSDDASKSGGTSEEWQARILADAGVPAHVESGRSLSDLAEYVGEGRGIIIEVNAGELWNNPDAYGSGNANHAIVVTGVAVDPRSGELLGAYVNDSGRGYPGDSGRFVSSELLQRMWADTGGSCVVTDTVRV
jgi:hypothetical protein